MCLCVSDASAEQRRNLTTPAFVSHPHVTPHARDYSSPHRHTNLWQTRTIKITIAAQPSRGDVHSFALNNYLYHTKKTAEHSEKYNGNKGYPIN
jgi:hypothetical protein